MRWRAQIQLLWNSNVDVYDAVLRYGKEKEPKWGELHSDMWMVFSSDSVNLNWVSQSSQSPFFPTMKHLSESRNVAHDGMPATVLILP